MSTRTSTTTGHLARLGFAEPSRAAGLLADPALAPLREADTGSLPRDVLEAIGATADPDQALLGLVRVLEAFGRPGESGPYPRGFADAVEVLHEPGPGRARLLGVLGASSALVDHLARHPGHLHDVIHARRHTGDEVRDGLVRAVTDPPEGRSATDELRIAYRAGLLRIAALDVTAPDPLDHLPEAAAGLAHLAKGALEAALVIARAEFGPGHEQCRLAVIAMGKTGGEELNYVSDVDVIFVAEPAAGADEETALRIGTTLAAGLMRACSTPTAEGSLWPVDAGLRPEGAQGPLVRTLASHRAYYQRWAKTWEFQALLKASFGAGDRELAEDYLAMTGPFVWEAASREHFVPDVQAMRRRVEEHIPPAEVGRQLKLGPGGLRDVEFSVQLLQLVHGRTDTTLRSTTTLDALAALSAGGYVAREDAASLDRSYRQLRALEHRIQLQRLRRTHLMPESPADLRRLGRSMGLRSEPAKSVLAERAATAREVRRIHERLFYRPLLSAVAQLQPDEVRLSPEAARERLAALGYRDPAGALRHIEALTTGVSRRASIQRTLLPVMLGWFASEADPDAGLLAFRRISEDLGTTHWYLKMLRDEGRAAERLAHALASSTYAADLLARSPESVAVLGDSGGLEPRTRQALTRTMLAAVGRRADAVDAVAAVRGIRRHELFRIVLADLAGRLDVLEVGAALTDLTAATVEAALTAVVGEVERRDGRPLGAEVLVVGMGSLGGAEMGYASDADVLFVQRDLDPAEPDSRVTQVVQDLVKLLGATGPDPALVLDPDLRPEGRNGPLVRSIESYAAYYERWAQTWEFQALVRATPLVGPEDLADEFTALIEPLRWRPEGLTAEQVREIRLLKARMEAERLPRGADPSTHPKLGPGGLTDVEWTVQLHQLQRAGELPALRVTGTVPALAALEAAGIISEPDAQALRQSLLLAFRMRNAMVVWRGRPWESVPSDLRDLDGVGRLLGLAPGTTAELSDRWRKVARRSRRATDFNFWESPPRGSVAL